MNFLGVGPVELLFVLMVALLVLGPGRVVEASRGLGKLVRQLRRLGDEWPKILEEEVDALDQPGREDEEEAPGERFQQGGGREEP